MKNPFSDNLTDNKTQKKNELLYLWKNGQKNIVLYINQTYGLISRPAHTTIYGTATAHTHPLHAASGPRLASVCAWPPYIPAHATSASVVPFLEPEHSISCVVWALRPSRDNWRSPWSLKCAICVWDVWGVFGGRVMRTPLIAERRKTLGRLYARSV